MIKKYPIFIITIVGIIIISAFIIHLWYSGYFFSLSKTELKENEQFDTISAIKNTKFGIPVDSFNITERKVKYNETFGQIINQLPLKPEEINQINSKIKGIFDASKIKAGQKFYIFSHNDSSKKIAHIIYENNQLEYIRISFNDTITIEKINKEFYISKRFAKGEISSSLWNTMLENNLNPELAIKLSEIYAWTIDFFGLAKGDNFRVIFDEILIDSVSVGISKIYAVNFNHKGKPYYAFLYNQDGKDNYYDENGQSLKKAFLKAPLSYARITSRFSRRRFHPILKIWRPHSGVDYAAPAGTPVHSIGNGTVIEKGFSVSAGNFIKIRHNSIYTSMYNHLSNFAKGIYKGSQVMQGQIIGYVGQTGYATGPHLDFRIWKNGTLVNPLTIEAPSIEPINKQNKENFEKLKSLFKNLLLHIQ